MTKSLIAVFLSLLAGGSLNVRSVIAQQTDPIPSIRKQYTAINKRAARYRKVKKELSGFSLEGGELLAYLDRGAIVKIAARHFGEGGNTVEEYYYQNGQLIFVFEKISHYDQPMSGKVIRTAENRYYFHDDNLIRWIDENGKAVSPGEDYRLKEKGLREHSNIFLAGARSSKRIVEAGN
jgi:hypothetical protein